MANGLQVLVDDAHSVLLAIGGSVGGDQAHGLLGLFVGGEDARADFLRLDVFDGVANELRHAVVGGMLSGMVGYVPSEGKVLPDESAHVDAPLDVGVVVCSVLVLLEETLAHGLLQERWKKVDEEVEYLLVGSLVFQLHDVERQYFLEHIVEKIVFLVLFRETGTDGKLGMLEADETHDVVGDEMRLAMLVLYGVDEGVVVEVFARGEIPWEHEESRVVVCR